MKVVLTEKSLSGYNLNIRRISTGNHQKPKMPIEQIMKTTKLLNEETNKNLKYFYYICISKKTNI